MPCPHLVRRYPWGWAVYFQQIQIVTMSSGMSVCPVLSLSTIASEYVLKEKLLLLLSFKEGIAPPLLTPSPEWIALLRSFLLCVVSSKKLIAR